MTDFQAACLDAVQSLLHSKELNSGAEEVRGNEESYLRLRVPIPGKEIDFYIYEDEAGYFVDGEWHIRESQDYDSPQELIAELLADLNQELGG
jgi:hypothetical protein